MQNVFYILEMRFWKRLDEPDKYAPNFFFNHLKNPLIYLFLELLETLSKAERKLLVKIE
jgi:hypothetical protein